MKWEMMRLGDLGTIVTGNTPKTKDKRNYLTKNICFFKPSDFEEKKVNALNKSQNYVSEHAKKEVRLLPTGSVLTTCIGIIGKVGLLSREATCNQQINAIIPNKKIVNSKFLAYSILIKQQEINAIANAPVVPIINKSQFSNVQISLPPLSIQFRIAQVLDKTQEMIDKRKKQIELLDHFVKSTFIEMFGDPITNPEGWHVRKIADCCEKIVGGGTPSKSVKEYFIGNIPWVTPKDMKTLFVYDSIDHINENAIKNSSTNIIPPNSLLMVIRSGILKRYLPVALNIKPMTINQDMKAFIPKRDIVTVEYLMYYFIHSQTAILANVRGVTADNIEFSTLRERRIPLPPLELQNRFAAIVKKSEKQKALLTSGLEQLERNYKSLMQKAFNGELF